MRNSGYVTTAAKHGGDIWTAAAEAGLAPERIVDFSANVHPWGAPPGVRGAVLRALSDIERYPAPYGGDLVQRIGERVGQPVVLGNGATELLVAQLRGARRLVLQTPCYGGYAEAALAAGVLAVYDQPPVNGDVVIIGRPNNPDGRFPSVLDIARLATRHPGVKIVVDESFLGFTREPSAAELSKVMSNVAVVASLTKTYAIPGLRLGWSTLLPKGALPPWSVNALAIAAGHAILQSWDWPLRLPLTSWRTQMQEELSQLPHVQSVVGAANFVLARLSGPWAAELRSDLLSDGLLIRDASTIPGLDAHYIRLCVRTAPENARAISALATALLKREG